jgi:hypothetical protein
MKKQILVAFGVVALLTAIVGLGTLQVSAQGPNNTYPGGAVYIDDQWHTIPGRTSLWYIFEYFGDRSEMNVFTPEQVRLPDTLHGSPIGRGSAQGTNSLMWAGRMFIAGTYYVQVLNNDDNAKPLLFRLAGSGVFVREPTATPTVRAPATATFTRTRTATVAASPNAVWTAMAVFAATMKAPPPGESPTGVVTATVQPSPAETPTATPTATLTPTPTRLPAAEFLDANNFWPQNAVYVLDGRERIVPGNSSLWFKFDYAGDGSLAEVKIPEASLRRLAFSVYSGEQINLLGLNAPAMGQGSAPLVNCGGVRCPSIDLVWSSRFPGAGTVYVQVTNRNVGQINFNLVVSGPGVILGRGQ